MPTGFAEPLRRPVSDGVDCGLDPESRRAARRRTSELLLEHAQHVAAESPADPFWKGQQEQPVERACQPRFASSRLARASMTAASRRRASAAATASPSRVSRKYRRRSSS